MLNEPGISKEVVRGETKNKSKILFWNLRTRNFWGANTYLNIIIHIYTDNTVHNSPESIFVLKWSFYIRYIQQSFFQMLTISHIILLFHYYFPKLFTPWLWCFLYNRTIISKDFPKIYLKSMVFGFLRSQKEKYDIRYIEKTKYKH